MDERTRNSEIPPERPRSSTNKGDRCVDEREPYGMWKKILEDVVPFFAEGTLGPSRRDPTPALPFASGHCARASLMSEYSREATAILGTLGPFSFSGCTLRGPCANQAQFRRK